MKKLKIFLIAFLAIFGTLFAVLYKLRGKGIIDKYFVKFYDNFLKVFYKINDFYEVEETE